MIGLCSHQDSVGPAMRVNSTRLHEINFKMLDFLVVKKHLSQTGASKQIFHLIISHWTNNVRSCEAPDDVVALIKYFSASQLHSKKGRVPGG